MLKSQAIVWGVRRAKQLTKRKNPKVSLTIDEEKIRGLGSNDTSSRDISRAVCDRVVQLTGLPSAIGLRRCIRQSLTMYDAVLDALESFLLQLKEGESWSYATLDSYESPLGIFASGEKLLNTLEWNFQAEDAGIDWQLILSGLPPQVLRRNPFEIKWNDVENLRTMQYVREFLASKQPGVWEIHSDLADFTAADGTRGTTIYEWICKMCPAKEGGFDRFAFWSRFLSGEKKLHPLKFEKYPWKSEEISAGLSAFICSLDAGCVWGPTDLRDHGYFDYRGFQVSGLGLYRCILKGLQGTSTQGWKKYFPFLSPRAKGRATKFRYKNGIHPIGVVHAKRREDSEGEQKPLIQMYIDGEISGDDPRIQKIFDRTR